MKFARLFGYLVLAASAVYFLAALSEHAHAVPAISWTPATVAVLTLCLGLYVAQVGAAGLAWHFWLHSLEEPSRPRLAISLFAMSQLAKYVPGGIAQHLARVTLGQRHGLSAPRMAVTIALEQGWALAAGIATAAATTLALGTLPAGASLPMPAGSLLVAVMLALCLGTGALWLFSRRRPDLLGRWFGAWRGTPPKTVVVCLLLYAVTLANAGWNIDLIARFVLGAEESHALLAIGVFAVAWVTGIVTLVAPGGLGVREAILLAGLTPAYGPGIALAAALSYRAVTCVGDGVAFLLAAVIEKRLRLVAAVPQ